jgi:hypothetical protein
MPSIDDWIDDRPSARLAYRADNDDLLPAQRRPTLVVPANDNRLGSWIDRDPMGNPVRVVRARKANPLLCRPHEVEPGRVPDIRPTDGMRHRAALAEWRKTAPANDSDILPRAPRNKGAHDLADCLPELRFWRVMTNAPSAWEGTISNAANDEETVGDEERENDEIRPSLHELVRCLPLRVRAVMKADAMPEDIRILTNDMEWRRGRMSRLGGLNFATAPRDVPNEDSEGSNVSGPVNTMPRAGELLEFRPPGRGRSRPTEHSREKRGGASVSNSPIYLSMLPDETLLPNRPRKERRRTNRLRLSEWLMDQTRMSEADIETMFKSWLRSQNTGPALVYEPGLPWQPAALRHLFLTGATSSKGGKRDGNGDTERVRRQVDSGASTQETAETDTVSAFRLAHADHGTLLDAAMTARSMKDIASVAGVSSPNTGKQRLVAACSALRTFRERLDNLQFLPIRAA